MPVAKFDKRTLRERCTSHVRGEIIAGAIKPGEHLIETRLSEELGVSRGTLREALRPLQNEGLVVDDGKGHLLVRDISAAEIGEVFEVRAAIEALAATLLCQRDDRSVLAVRLRKSLEPLKDTGLSFGERLDTDLGFHELMCRLTDNATLVSSWRNLIGQIEMMIIAAGPERAGRRMQYGDHVVIVEAIEGGDITAARATVENHMKDFSGRYVGDSDEQVAEAS